MGSSNDRTSSTWWVSLRGPRATHKRSKDGTAGELEDYQMSEKYDIEAIVTRQIAKNLQQGGKEHPPRQEKPLEEVKPVFEPKKKEFEEAPQVEDYRP
uniref:Uncharacterized protein n=1 Tax=Romanomermis culicivorax TaxID=13658 RepID=A0A915KVG0_ROMCU